FQFDRICLYVENVANDCNVAFERSRPEESVWSFTSYILNTISWQKYNRYKAQLNVVSLIILYDRLINSLSWSRLFIQWWNSKSLSPKVVAIIAEKVKNR